VPEDFILHYQIEVKLGEGGMGEVFLATDTKLDRKVALKFLPESLRKDPEARERLLREAKAASRLSHGNIVTVYAVEEADGRDFIAMEYIQGLLLSEYAEQKKPNLRDSLGIAIGIASGLQKAHEAGIVHRDLKPSNILVDREGKAKILDFGVAKMEGASKLTETGSTVGTVAYMSPEQAQGADVDARSDLFGLGAMLYELVAGQLPFRGDHKAAVLYAIANEEADPLARYKADVPDELQRIIAKCLAKDRGNRFQSAADLVTDLKQLRRALDGSSAGHSTATSTVAAAPSKSSSKVWIGGAVVVALLALAFVFKPWKITVEPTDEAVAVSNRLAIMYFDNLADPDDTKRLGEIAANLLITDLSETPNLDVISTQRLFDLLKQSGHEGDRHIDRGVATQVASTAGARWMLLGSILQSEPQFVITAQIVDMETGSSVASQRIQGEQGDNLFAVMDQVSREVKADLAMPQQVKGGSEADLAAITTTSEDAYMLYLEGVEHQRRYRHDLAIEKFRQATALDSTFAMAYYQWSKSPREDIEIEKLANLALKYIDRASPKEQLFIKAIHASEVENDYPKSLAFCREIIAKYPGETEGYMGMFWNCRRLKMIDSSLAVLEELIEVDPLYRDAYNQMAYRYQEVGNFERSIWAINKYIELAPDEPNPYDSRADLYAFEGKLDEALKGYRQVLKIDPGFFVSRLKISAMALAQGNFEEAEREAQFLLHHEMAGIRTAARFMLAQIPAYQGKFNEALGTLDQGIGANALDDLHNASIDFYLSKMMILAERGDSAEALAEGARALADKGIAQDNNRRWIHFERLRLLAGLGRLPEAEREFEQIKRVPPESGRELENSDTYHASLAVLAEARGDMDEAISHREFCHSLESEFFNRLYLGQAYLAAGRLSQAVDTLEAVAKKFDENRFYATVENVTVYYELAQAYEQSGWNDKAIEQYEHFLHLWKDADPELPRVEDAKARVARLKAAS
jgi:serine/threonine protein kinase/predicted Zn-dependent protease